jgi:RNA polymerase sigma factor (sigma-70 family)
MEETNAVPQEIEAGATVSERAILLTRFIENHAASLMITLREYVRKADLVPDEEAVQEAALELLDEVYLEALKTVSHFDPSRPPRAWLLGIANKLMLRKREGKYTRRQREVTVSDLRREYQEELTDDDVLDRLAAFVHEGPEQGVIASEQFEYLLSLVSQGDRLLLRLAIELDLDGQSLAQALGCSYNAALVRLCRARQHLRRALERQRGESNE